jgi:hypothetical protein
MYLIKIFQFGIYVGYKLNKSSENEVFSHEKILVSIKSTYTLSKKASGTVPPNDQNFQENTLKNKKRNNLLNDFVQIHDIAIKKLPNLDELVYFLIPKTEFTFYEKGTLVYSFDSKNYANHFSGKITNLVNF